MELYYLAIAAVFVGLGLAVRNWWLVLIVALPSLMWLLVSIPRWDEPQGDGHTGASYFLWGFVLIGPPIVLSALGVLVGRRVFPPRR